MMDAILEILHWLAIMSGGGLVLALLLARWFAMNAESTDDPEICESKSLEFLADARAKRWQP